MFEKILIGLDGSTLAEQVIPYAIEQAVNFDSRVVLLRVIGNEAVAAPARATASYLQAMAIEEDKAHKYLEGIEVSFRERGIVTEVAVIQGEPSDTLISYAEQNGADLIILATHGYGGLKRLVLGSVADRVIRETKQPVLAIKPVGES